MYLKKLLAANTQNVQNFLKQAEASDILGTGLNHFYSKTHLDLMQMLGEKRFETEIGDLTTSISMYKTNF